MIAITALALISWWAWPQRTAAPSATGPNQASDSGDGSPRNAAEPLPSDKALTEPERRDTRASDTVTPALPGSLTVIVQTRAGDPVPGLAIELDASTGARGSPHADGPGQRTLATDAQGRATADDLPPGPWTVTLGVDLESQVIVESGRRAETTLILEGYAARVRVLDRGGQPAAGAEVQLWRPRRVLEAPQWFTSAALGTTSADGTLAFVCPPAFDPHTCWVAATHPVLGASPARKMPPQTTETPTVVLRLDVDGGGLEVAARADGVPDVEATITVRPIDAPGYAEDAQGYRLTHRTWRGRCPLGSTRSFAFLAPGDYRVIVAAAGWAPAHRDVAIVAGETRRLQVELERGGTLAARVRFRDGTPAAGATFNVRPGIGGWRNDRTGRVDDEGRFTVVDLEPGALDWRVTIGGSTTAGTVAIRGGETTALDVEFANRGEREGTLRDDAGTPLVGWSIWLLEPSTGRTLPEVTTDGEGRFALEGEVGAEHAFIVKQPGIALAIDSATPDTIAFDTDAGAPEPLEIVVPRAAMASAFVAGRLTDDEGAPALTVSRTVVVAEARSPDERQRLLYPGSSMAAADLDEATGSFRIGPLPPRAYRLRFDRSDGLRLVSPAFVLGPHGTTDVGTLTWPAAGTVRFRPRLAPGMEPGDVLAAVSGKGEERGVRLTDAQGEICVEAGTWTATVYGDGFRAERTELTVLAGHVVEFDPVLRPAVRFPFRASKPEGETTVSVELIGPEGRRAFSFELGSNQAHDDWAPQLTEGTHELRAVGASGRRYRAVFEVEFPPPGSPPPERRELHLAPAK